MAELSPLLLFCWLAAVHSQSDIIIQTTPSIVIGYDALDIRCSPHPSWSIQSITRIQLFKDTKGTLGSSASEVVFMYLNLTVLAEQFQWSDLSVKGRGLATGSLSPTIDSFMRLLVPASSTLCEDAASYRCEVSGTNFGAPSSRSQDFFIGGLGKADQINDFEVVLQTGYSSETDRYDYNSVIVITCNATVGLPALSMHWCSRTANMSELSPFPDTDQISTTGVLPDGTCQNRQESTLTYQVTEVDMGAQVMCEVTNVSDCTTNFLSVSYSFDVVFGRVDLNATTNVTLRQEAIQIGCFQATTGEGLKTVDRLEIFRDTNDGSNMTRVVSAVLDNVTGQSVLEFHDISLTTRAVISGDITAPSSAFILLLIPANNSECDDITTYRCQLTATSVADTVVSDYKDTTIYAETLPEEISPLRIQDSMGASVSPGTAVQVGETIKFTCNGTVGNPPMTIRWCIRKYEGVFTEYPQTDDIITSDVNSVNACQNIQNSTLTYNVTSGDIETTFMCEIGSGGVCGDGIVMSQVSIYAVDMAISADVPGVITADVNDLLVRCSQTASGIGLLREPEILLYRNTSVIDDSIVLSLAADSSTNQSTITWFDEEFKTRAAAVGDIINIASAYLNISVNSSHVTCLDAGNYKCVLNGHIGSERIHLEDRGSLDVIVHPGHMAEILVQNDNEEVTDQRSFPVGTKLTLTCNSTVGIPPLGLIWCIRRTIDNEFISLGSGNSSVPVSSGSCQLRQTSELHFNVTTMDSDTVVLCEVGNFSTCGTGIVSRQVRINAVDLALTTDVTSIVTSGDRLNVTCFQSASGVGELQHTEITLYRNTSDGINGTDERIVSFRHNSTSNTSVCLWYGNDVVTRATVDGDVTDPGTAYVSLSISNVTCLDQGLYRCEMTGVTPTNTWRTRGNSKLIEVYVPADSVHEITGNVDDRIYTDRGSFRSGTEVVLTCNATVGVPPGNLTWCVMRAGESEYAQYNDTLGKQSEPFPCGQCQYMRTSVINYTVTSRDTHTLMRCEVGQNSTCGGDFVNGVFEIFAVDVSIDFRSTPKVIGGFDAINMTCNASDVTSFTWLEVMLYRNTSDMDTAIVSFYYNATTSAVTWLDSGIEHRAAARASVEGSSATLEMSLGPDVTCSDEGYYTCVMWGDMGLEETLVIQDQQYTEVIELPVSISDVAAQTDSGIYANEGVFPVGSDIVLLCNSTVGRPPLELHWCVRRAGQTVVPYEGIVNQTEPVQIGNCQFTRTSSLVYTVMSEDTRTEFICDVGSNGTCGDGHLSSVFTLYAVDMAISADVPGMITADVNDLLVRCSQTASGIGLLREPEILFYRNTSVIDDGIVLSLAADSSTNQSTITWFDEEFKTRAAAVGDIINITSAYLNISVNSSHVTCLDAGNYKCVLNGHIGSERIHLEDRGSLDVIVHPGHMAEILVQNDNEEVTDQRSFPVGTKLTLTCNSTVGIPPLGLIWCIRRTIDDEFISLGSGNSSVPVSSGSCQLRQTSELHFNVTTMDSDTVVLCEVGNFSTCGTGIVSRQVRINAVDLALTTDVTSIVTSGDRLNVTCFQSASGVGELQHTEITLYRNTSDGINGTDERTVSFRHNSTSNTSVCLWYGDDVVTRATVDGDVTDPGTAYVSLSISNVTCLDHGLYRCEMTGVTPTNTWRTRGNSKLIEVYVPADSVHEITGNVDDRIYTDRGSFRSGTEVVLTCNATVGVPPGNLTWCVMRAGESEYAQYNDTLGKQSEPFPCGQCQYMRTSVINYTVTSRDTHTLMRCEVGQNSTCGGDFVNGIFEIFAVDVSIDFRSTPKVIGGFDAINMTCNASDITSFTWLEVMLYRNTSDLDTAIVSFYYNATTSAVTWLDSGIEHRAAARASVEGTSATLEMSLGPEVTCSDEGYYTCVMWGDMGLEETLVIQDQQYTEVIELPVSISDVAAQTDSGIYANEGVFPVGSDIVLLCNSTVGRPPLELHWCVRRAGQTVVPYEGIVNQTEPVQIGNCQFTRTSSLVYTVMSEDTRTEFICDAGSNGTCGDGHLSSVFTLYAALVSVEAESTPLATSGVDNVNITCSVTGLRLFDDWMINIYQNTSGDFAGEIILISVVHTGMTNSTSVIWWDPELHIRANYSTDLTQIDTAKLEISFQGDQVTCLDGGLYRCELSGNTSLGDSERADDTTPVHIVVPPDDMGDLRAEDDDGYVFDGGVFPVESGLILTCNSSVGNPPLDIYWCVMTHSDSHWLLYPNTSHITQSKPTSGPCNQRKVSTLKTEVKVTDVYTRYLCEVGQNLTCGQGFLNASFSVYAVDVGVAIQGTTSVIAGRGELQVNCSQNASGIGLLENTTISIYHQTEGSPWYLLVSLTYNMTSGSDVITWHTPEMKELWVAKGSTTPLNTAYLELTLTNVTCRESGSYECVLQGQVGSYYDVMKKDRLDVNVKVLPDKIEPIEGQISSAVVTGEGSFPVGRTVSLLCNSTVGDPPANLYWRFKRVNDTDYTLLNTTDQSEPTASGSCQLRRTSHLLWTVDGCFNATFTIVAIPCDGDCAVLTTPVYPTLSDDTTSAVIAASIIAPLFLLAIIIALVGLWKFPGVRALFCKRKSYGPKVKPHDSGKRYINSQGCLSVLTKIDMVDVANEIEDPSGTSSPAENLDVPLDLNGVGSSAPPTGTSLTNGSAI